jgi:hypothetical protein
MSETTERRAFDWFTPVRFGILLAVLIFAAFPQVLLGLQTFVVRDYGFFAYPLAHFQQECFRNGELPFWDPYNNCGVPFLAQWNTMPLYPPALIYLLLPLQWSLSFFCLLHLWFAGFGMFFLARRWTGNSFAAAFAGVAFAFNGLMLNLLMWPSHIATLSWMPWVVLAGELAWREGGRKIILAALAGALQMLAGGPEIIFLTWILLLSLWIQQLVKGEASRVSLFWRFPLVMALVIALAAAQLLPFLDLATHSQRSAGYADTRWSMPGWGWANFLVPMAFGTTRTEGIFFQHEQYWTSSYYLGLGALWLALLTVLGLQDRWAGIRGNRPIRVINDSKRLFQCTAEFCSERDWLLSVVAVIGLLCAFGENTPFYPLARRLVPQLSFITYPVKFVMVVVFAAPLLAAFALANPARIRKWILPVGIVLLLLITGILIWTQHAPLAGDDPPAALANGLSRAVFLFLNGAILFLLARNAESSRFRFLPLVLVLVAWLDVYTHEPAQNPTVPPSVYEPNLARARLAMQPQPALGGSRAMVTPAAAMGFISFALSDPKNNYLAKRLGYCANCNLLDSVPKVDGFFSLVTRESDTLTSLLYGATNANFSKFNDFLGVSQITAPDEFFHWQPRRTFLLLVTAGQKPVFLDDPATLRALTQPDFDGGKIVFLPPEAKSLVTVTNQTAARVLSSQFKAQRADIEVEATEPSLVVVAQTYYHNWRVYVDSRPAHLLRANYAFQSFQVPAGRHRVRLVYQDMAFQCGAAVSICLAVSCFILLPRLGGKHPFRQHP